MKITCRILHKRKRKGVDFAFPWEPVKIADEFSKPLDDYEYAKFMQIIIPSDNKTLRQPVVLAERQLENINNVQGKQSFLHFDKITYVYYHDQQSLHLLNLETKI